MSNPYFKFKQFTVWHDRCAMKVGTDGVLLGAWAEVAGCRDVLDVGTGTGLIALQLAQRNPESEIVAIELDKSAALQAAENVCRSPWAGRIEVICCDFRSYMPDRQFDLIVSNPPYFVDALQCPEEQRNIARHAGGLNYDTLFRCAARLLRPKGRVCVIVPFEVGQMVEQAAFFSGLYPSYRTEVFTKPGKPCRRLLYAFGTVYSDMMRQDTLYIEGKDQSYTPEYIALTGGFYLNMP